MNFEDKDKAMQRATFKPISNIKVAYFEEKSLNLNFHRSIYYHITSFKFFPLHFQQLRHSL